MRKISLVIVGFFFLAACTSTNENPYEKVLIGETRYEIVKTEMFLMAPSGTLLYVRIISPNIVFYNGKRFPLLINVPGGVEPGAPSIDSPRAIELASRGMFVVAWNAEGRGGEVINDFKSGGTIDFNGFRDQDGMKAIIEFATQLDGVDQSNIGVISGSYGITMATGCLSRYPDLLVGYFIDVEGPSDSFVTMREAWLLDTDLRNDDSKAYDIFKHHSIETDPSPENQAFWSERQAKLFVNFRCRYLRIQTEKDHSQPNTIEFNQPPLWYHNKHAIDMVNAAIDGGVPWVRMNRKIFGNQVNAKYDYNVPFWIPGSLRENQNETLFAVIEMVNNEMN